MPFMLDSLMDRYTTGSRYVPEPTSSQSRRGQQAPSITALCQQHGHARQTCAKAYRVLEGEGLVRRFPGLGYYVT